MHCNKGVVGVQKQYYIRKIDKMCAMPLKILKDLKESTE